MNRLQQLVQERYDCMKEGKKNFNECNERWHEITTYPQKKVVEAMEKAKTNNASRMTELEKKKKEFEEFYKGDKWTPNQIKAMKAQRFVSKQELKNRIAELEAFNKAQADYIEQTKITERVLNMEINSLKHRLVLETERAQSHFAAKLKYGKEGLRATIAAYACLAVIFILVGVEVIWK